LKIIILILLKAAINAFVIAYNTSQIKMIDFKMLLDWDISVKF